jgi:hypothetical protein
VAEYYTWNRIADYYCELITLARSSSRGRRESIHAAPGPANEVEMDVLSSR